MKKLLIVLGYNTFFQIIGKIFSVILSFFSIGLLTRYLGKEGFGNYSLILAYLSIFSILGDFGLQMTMTRELVKEKRIEVYGSYFLIKCLLFILSIIVPCFTLFFLPYSKSIKTGIIIGSFGFGLGYLNNFGIVIFQANLRLDLVTLVDIIIKLTSFIFLGFFIYLKMGIYGIINTILLGNILGTIAIIFWLKKLNFLNVSFKNIGNFIFATKFIKNIFKKTIPMGIINILFILFFKLDTLILSFLKGAKEVGIYTLSYKIIENMQLIWIFYLSVLYPLLSGFLKDREEKKANFIIKTSILISIFLSILLIIIGEIFAPFIIRVLGGNEFKESVWVFRILLLSLPMLFINNLFYHKFLAEEKILFLIKIYLTSLIISIILNLLLISKFSYWGSAVSVFLTEIYLLLFYLFLNRKFQLISLKDKKGVS